MGLSEKMKWDIGHQYHLCELKYIDTKQYTFSRTNTNTKIYFGFIGIVASEDVEKEKGLKV